MNCIEYWESYFAAHDGGVVLAPLNIRLSPSELKFILQDGCLRALIIGPEYLALVKSLVGDCPQLEHLILIGSDDEPGCIGYEALVSQSEPLEDALRDWSEGDLINLCYTGGTTGLPKGVMLSQRNVVSNARHVVQTHGLCASDTLAPYRSSFSPGGCLGLLQLCDGRRETGLCPIVRPAGFSGNGSGAEGDYYDPGSGYDQLLTKLSAGQRI